MNFTYASLSHDMCMSVNDCVSICKRGRERDHKVPLYAEVKKKEWVLKKNSSMI